MRGLVFSVFVCLSTCFPLFQGHAMGDVFRTRQPVWETQGLNVHLSLTSVTMNECNPLIFAECMQLTANIRVIT